MSVAPLLGLVLAGGRSTRMKRDKAALTYRGATQLERAWDLLIRERIERYDRMETRSRPLSG